MTSKNSPYLCHVLVCVNDRQGVRKACADGVGSSLKDALKAAVDERGWKGRVRVSSSGCLGLCAEGPNVLLYPQSRWFSAVTPADIPEIIAVIAQVVQP